MTAFSRSAACWLTLVALVAPGGVMAQGVVGFATAPALHLGGKIAGRSTVVHAQDLAEIGRETIRAETPWTAGPTVYEGVKLARLLDHVGADGQDLEIVDRRGDSLGMAIADATARGAFLVDRRAAADDALGKRGPFWLVFPVPPDGQPAMGPPAIAGIVELRIR